MAITIDGIDKAEVWNCYQLEQRRMPDGSWTQIERPLPWAFVRFTDVGEERRYVMTCDTGGCSVGLTDLGRKVFIPHKEMMRNTAFPHDVDRGPMSPSDGDARYPGPLGVHFIGAV